MLGYELIGKHNRAPFMIVASAAKVTTKVAFLITVTQILQLFYEFLNCK